MLDYRDGSSSTRNLRSNRTVRLLSPNRRW